MLHHRLPTTLKACALTLLACLSSLSADPTAPDVINQMRRVANWQIENPSSHPPHDWTQAPFYLGLANLYQVSKDEKYKNALDAIAKRCNYQPGRIDTFADDHAVLQAWLELYRIQPDPVKITPATQLFQRFQTELAHQPVRSISGGCLIFDWCDSLFMSPPVWANLSQITQDPKFLEWADREWWTTTDTLYDPSEHLFYRDTRFFSKRTESGKKVFWSRGNGWVCGGLVHMLDYLPAQHPSRPKYLALYHEMMRSLIKLQGNDGLWRSSLLDPSGPQGESSGSSFFAYSMAWGLNRGLLPKDPYLPAVLKTWNALTNNVQPNGMLGFVQRIDDQPDPQATNATSTEVYGSGAFLLAGAEIARLLDPSKRRSDLAQFAPNTPIPASYQPLAPACFARKVTERADDFSWENDLVAFRTYGPALRNQNEDSGVDCWFKRVPYPIINKWNLEEKLFCKYSKSNKTYHVDHGEGFDDFHVGGSRGCGGASVYADGKIWQSDTYVDHRIISQSPDRVVFELDYYCNFKNQLLKETKRISLIMGEHLYQCDSSFFLDGKPTAFEVAIGINPQEPNSVATFQNGIMSFWENHHDYELGTAVIVDPKRIVKTTQPSDIIESVHPTINIKPDSNHQALTIVKTDENGKIRWFSGFAWAPQGKITSEAQWQSYLAEFAKKYLSKGYN